jgi:hypothetical protein
MSFRGRGLAMAAAVAIVGIAPAGAVTREVQSIPAFHLTFGRSVLNQLTFDTYRTPFDELQTRPYNLLFTNIARQPNFGAWPGQQGSYARYVDALIGNNGAANVDNDADAIEGTMIRRETGTVAWGFNAALLAGTLESNDLSGTESFSDNNDLKAFDVRGGAAFQIANDFVLGAALRAVIANDEDTDSNFEPGVGGVNAEDTFKQNGIAADIGVRQFLSTTSSWEADATLAYGTAKQDTSSQSVDDTGTVTDTFVAENLDVNDLSIAVAGSYNRLRKESLGETEYRGGLSFSQRKLSNNDLAFSTTGGVTTPLTTLIADDPVTTTGLFASARSIFQAGETEVFMGARIDYTMTDGKATLDDAGTVSSESIDDSLIALGVTLGVRQPILKDKLRIIVSGHGDFVSANTKDGFTGGATEDKSTLTVTQYAVGLEAVLANVTLDLAWLQGEEATVVPPPIGLNSGSRRTIELDKLVFSAAVSW